MQFSILIDSSKVTVVKPSEVARLNRLLVICIGIVITVAISGGILVYVFNNSIINKIVGIQLSFCFLTLCVIVFRGIVPLKGLLEHNKHSWINTNEIRQLTDSVIEAVKFLSFIVVAMVFLFNFIF